MELDEVDAIKEARKIATQLAIEFGIGDHYPIFRVYWHSDLGSLELVEGEQLENDYDDNDTTGKKKKKKRKSHGKKRQRKVEEDFITSEGDDESDTYDNSFYQQIDNSGIII